MKLLTHLAMLALFTFAGNAIYAQTVPAELAGTYSGKGSIINFITASGTPSKEKGILVLQMETSTSSTLIFSGSSSGSSSVAGTAIFASNYLFVKYELAPDISISGRLSVKGSAGKQSLSGTLQFIEEGFAGPAELASKVKKLPVL